MITSEKKKEWKAFLKNLEVPIQFLYADDMRILGMDESIKLPILVDEGSEVLIDSKKMNSFDSIDKLMEEVKISSKKTGEKVWELPLWPEYCRQIKSDVADIKNMGSAGQAGSIAAGAFLKEFVGENIPWVHFDIAGTAWGAKPSSINPKGSATGVAIRLVLDMLGR